MCTDDDAPQAESTTATPRIEGATSATVAETQPPPAAEGSPEPLPDGAAATDEQGKVPATAEVPPEHRHHHRSKHGGGAIVCPLDRVPVVKVECKRPEEVAYLAFPTS